MKKNTLITLLAIICYTQAGTRENTQNVFFSLFFFKRGQIIGSSDSAAALKQFSGEFT